MAKKIAPFIIAVSKQDIPDKGIYSIPQELMDDEMNKLIKKNKITLKTLLMVKKNQKLVVDVLGVVQKRN